MDRIFCRRREGLPSLKLYKREVELCLFIAGVLRGSRQTDKTGKSGMDMCSVISLFVLHSRKNQDRAHAFLF